MTNTLMSEMQQRLMRTAGFGSGKSQTPSNFWLHCSKNLKMQRLFHKKINALCSAGTEIRSRPQ